MPWTFVYGYRLVVMGEARLCLVLEIVDEISRY